MSRYQYAVILHPDTEEGGYTVTVPALPGCVTQGETLEEAIAMAKDAIRLYIETLVDEGEPIPEEQERCHERAAANRYQAHQEADDRAEDRRCLCRRVRVAAVQASERFRCHASDEHGDRIQHENDSQHGSEHPIEVCTVTNP